MITQIEIENFKGIGRNVKIDLRPITLMFGANSAGKSSVIQSLHYLREILVHDNPNPGATNSGGSFVDLGGFDRFVHNHDINSKIRLRVHLNVSAIHFPEYLRGGADEYVGYPRSEISQNIHSSSIEFVISKRNKQVHCSEYLSSLNGSLFARILSTDGMNENQCQLHVNMDHPLLDKEFESERNWDQQQFADCVAKTQGAIVRSKCNGNEMIFDLKTARNAIPAWGVPLEIDFQKHSDMDTDLIVTEGLSQLIVGPLDSLRRQLSNFLYIGPLREIPTRNHENKLNRDPRRWASGIAAWDSLHECSLDDLNEINVWLSGNDRLDSKNCIVRKKFQSIEIDSEESFRLLHSASNSVTVEELRNLIWSGQSSTRLYIKSPTSGQLDVCDVGVGLSQLIPILVMAIIEEEPINAIEQPELHLHPRLQAALGDVLLHAIANHSNRIFLVETHSEHLILRILRRIRETHNKELPSFLHKVDPESIAVHFLESTPLGVKATRLRIDEEGEFADRWPYGFFDERSEELF